jgi:hypothetical protein
LIHDAGGEILELAEATTLGRSRETVVPVGDLRVARHHARIREQEDGYWFFNLGNRREAFTRKLDKPILVRGEFLHALEAGKAFCQPCGSRQVKGRGEPWNSSP